MKDPKKNQEQNRQPVMRFKFINLKSSAYPNPLTESDYLGLKVGDVVYMGYTHNVIYRVYDITREVATQTEIDYWERYIALVTGGSTKVIIRDQKAYDLLQEYKKNNNFGCNRIYLEVLLRGSKVPKRSKYVSVWELEGVKSVDYSKTLTKVKLEDLIKTADLNCYRIDRKAQAILDRKVKFEERKQALIDLENKLNPKLPEPVPTGIDEIEEKETTAILVPSQEDIKELESVIEWVQ